jgi:hypothetical protein
MRTLPHLSVNSTEFLQMGRGSYARDVGYVMSTAVPIEKRREWEDELFDYYLEQLAKHGGPQIPKDEAWVEVGIQSFTVLGYVRPVCFAAIPLDTFAVDLDSHAFSGYNARFGSC